jgi:hypothetical protein
MQSIHRTTESDHTEETFDINSPRDVEVNCEITNTPSNGVVRLVKTKSDEFTNRKELSLGFHSFLSIYDANNSQSQIQKTNSGNSFSFIFLIFKIFIIFYSELFEFILKLFLKKNSKKLKRERQHHD